MQLPQIRVDYANHYIVGQGIYVLVRLLTVGFLSKEASKNAAFGVAVLLAALKEASDWVINWRKRRQGQLATHGVDPVDFILTAGGALLLYTLES